MPNWCIGNIRFRGNIDNIIRLISDKIVVCRFSDEGDFETITSPSIIDITKDDNSIVEEIVISTDIARSWFYIEGTKRNFIDSGSSTIEIPEVYKLDENKYIIVLTDFQAAWCIYPEPYIEMSKEYGVDIHIFGWERGMRFDQEIEIINGELVKNISNDGTNWVWETAMPYLGG